MDEIVPTITFSLFDEETRFPETQPQVRRLRRHGDVYQDDALRQLPLPRYQPQTALRLPARRGAQDQVLHDVSEGHLGPDVQLPPARVL